MKCITEILTTSFFLCHFVIFTIPERFLHRATQNYGMTERAVPRLRDISAFVISQLYEVLRRNLSSSFMV
jgi:hypothetical protein